VVADPVRGDIYTATKGGGANLNGSRIRASALTDLSTALVGTGFSYDPSRRRRQATVLMQVIPEVRDIRRFGAASLDLCLVASGRLDAYYEKGLSRWDYAAGALVAAEAGARLGDPMAGLRRLSSCSLCDGPVRPARDPSTVPERATLSADGA
jgi:myo-inositol-1(or 4)-monophosphatase